MNRWGQDIDGAGDESDKADIDVLPRCQASISANAVMADDHCVKVNRWLPLSCMATIAWRMANFSVSQAE